jgi:hypothetical protein
MKKLPLIFVVFLFLFRCNLAFSQEWAPVGSTWLYTYYFSTENEPPYNFYKYEIVKDTLIDNKIMRKMEGRHLNDETGNTLLFTEYIYKEDNKVYFYKWGQHKILYDFSVNVGDFYTGYTNISPDLSSVFTCTLKFNYQMNGNTYTSFVFNPEGDVNYGDEVMNQVGSMHYFFPDTAEVSVPEYERLRCYITADTLFYYDEFYYEFCDYYKSLYLAEVETKELSFHPNPVNPVSTVFIPYEFGNLNLVRIYSLNGKSLSHWNVQNRHIQIQKEDFEPGIYFMEVETELQKLTGKFMVE